MYTMLMYIVCFIGNVKSVGNKHQNLWSIYDYIINNQPKWLKIRGKLCRYGEGSVFQNLSVNLSFKVIYLTTASKEIITASPKQTGRYYSYKKQGQTLCRLGEGSMIMLPIQNNTSKMDKNKINIYLIETKLYANPCHHARRGYGQITVPVIPYKIAKYILKWIIR